MAIQLMLFHISQWDLDHIHRMHLTSDQPCNLVCINNDTKLQVIFPDEEDAYYDLDDFIRIINTSSLDLDF